MYAYTSAVSKKESIIWDGEGLVARSVTQFSQFLRFLQDWGQLRFITAEEKGSSLQAGLASLLLTNLVCRAWCLESIGILLYIIAWQVFFPDEGLLLNGSLMQLVHKSLLCSFPINAEGRTPKLKLLRLTWGVLGDEFWLTKKVGHACNHTPQNSYCGTP